MWKRKAFGSLAVAAAGFCLSSGSLEAQRVPILGGLYGGIGGVYTDFRDRETDSGWGYRGHLGYVFYERPPVGWISTEIGLMRSGSYVRGDNRTDRLTNADFSFLGTLTPIPNVDLFGRVGLEFGDSSGFFYGAGFDVGTGIPNMTVRAEYQHRDDFHVVSVGLRFRIP